MIVAYPACSSAQWFVGTSVLTSSNVPLKLRAAFIVVYAPKSAGRFLEMPLAASGKPFFSVPFLERKGTCFLHFVRFAAGIRINEQVERDISRTITYSRHSQALTGINMAHCSCSSASCFTPRGYVIPLPCGKWSCPECARKLATEWAIRARLGVQERRAYFWTVTMPGSIRTAEYAYEILPDAWDKFRRVIQVLRGEWSYVAFVEGQPEREDMPHFHMLSLVKCPIRLKDLAVACGFGQQAKDELVSDKKAARYVSKYLTKQSPSTPKGFHRVRCSQDWPKLPDIKRQPLLVKSRGEFWLDYFLRVSEVCNLSITEVIDRWSDATGMTFD